MFKFLFITPLLLVFFVSLAPAEDLSECEPKDMSPLLGPVRSQGNIGWCYAHTAADLISYKFRNDWHGYQASAVFIALGYNSKQNSDQPGNYIFTTAGDIRAAVKYASEFGYSCPRQLDDILVNGGFNIGIKQKLHLAEYLKLLFENRNKSAKDLNIYQSYIQTLREKKSIISFMSHESLERALSLNLNLAVMEIAKEVCKPYQLPMSLEKEKVRRHFSADKEYYDDVLQKVIYAAPNLMKLIDRQITLGNVVGIDYPMKLISANLETKKDHASVIVGRRQHKGQCQYKVRNSWGSACNYTVNGKTYPHYNKKVECVEGHVWINSSDLKPAVDGIVYIK